MNIPGELCLKITKHGYTAAGVYFCTRSETEARRGAALHAKRFGSVTHVVRGFTKKPRTRIVGTCLPEGTVSRPYAKCNFKRKRR